MTLVSLVLKRDPAMLGLQPDDRGPLTDTQLISARAQNDKESGISLRDALRTRQLWLLALGKFADFYCLMTIVAHIVWHGKDLGLGEAAAGILVVIGGISILGRLAVGRISDQFGSKRAIQTCFILLFVSFVFLLTIENPKLLFVFALIYGIAHGGFFTATSPSVAEYFGTLNPESLDQRVDPSCRSAGTVESSATVASMVASNVRSVSIVSGFSCANSVCPSKR